MRERPPETKFFICSDRPGCILWLEQEFPKRLIHNEMIIEYEVDYIHSFCEWYCLAACNEMILSSSSSFSHEAAKMNDAIKTFV